MSWWSRLFCGVDERSIRQPVSRPQAGPRPSAASVSERLSGGRLWLDNQAEYNQVNQTGRVGLSQLKQRSRSVNDIPAVNAFYGRIPQWKGQVAALIKKSGSDRAQCLYLVAIQHTLEGMDKSQAGLADIKGAIERAFKLAYSGASPALSKGVTVELGRVEKLRAIKKLVNTMHDAGSVLSRGDANNAARRLTR